MVGKDEAMLEVVLVIFTEILPVPRLYQINVTIVLFSVQHVLQKSQKVSIVFAQHFLCEYRGSSCYFCPIVNGCGSKISNVHLAPCISGVLLSLEGIID